MFVPEPRATASTRRRFVISESPAVRVYVFPPRRGGLLVVLVIALVLLSISLGTAVPAAKNQVRREKEDELRFILGEFRRAVRKFCTANGRLPTGFPELLGDDQGVPYLRRVYIDPITGTADWVWEEASDSVRIRSASEEASLAGVPYREFR